jgi:hypothetical protein
MDLINSGVADVGVSYLRQGESPAQANGSYRDQKGFKPFVRHRQAVFFQGLDITLDSFLDIGNGLFSGFPLADTTRQTGALSHPPAVLARIYNHLSHNIHRFKTVLVDINLYNISYFSADQGAERTFFRRFFLATRAEKLLIQIKKELTWMSNGAGWPDHRRQIRKRPLANLPGRFGEGFKPATRP